MIAELPIRPLRARRPARKSVAKPAIHPAEPVCLCAKPTCRLSPLALMLVADLCPIHHGPQARALGRRAS